MTDTRIETWLAERRSIRATAEKVGVSYDTLARVLRFPRTSVQERTYQAILRAHQEYHHDKLGAVQEKWGNDYATE